MNPVQCHVMSYSIQTECLACAGTQVLAASMARGVAGIVTGPPGALSFDVKPEIAQEKSL